MIYGPHLNQVTPVMAGLIDGQPYVLVRSRKTLTLYRQNELRGDDYNEVKLAVEGLKRGRYQSAPSDKQPA